jgi:formamidopyrimidine-DNA glycosylase
MPELPEVETIVRELRPHVLNRKITRVELLRTDVVGFPYTSIFKKGITNKIIKNLTRKAKYIIFILSDNSSLIIHLRLSGQLLVFNENKKDLPKFERIRFYLSGKKVLSFVEPRVLGRAYWVKDQKIPAVLKGLRNLGLEPIDKRFGYEYLYSKIHGRKAPIKNLLLDQAITAGVGNIYSDEALFIAGIHPLRRANTLKKCDIEKLAKALRHVINSGIRSKGTTVSDYLRPDGSEGTYQFKSFVFDREGEPCRVCKTIIKFAKIGNRRTRFCPKCQPIKHGNSKS